ncbi:MAG: sigma-54 dependent transcriptional regulator [Gemmataceae bacterium]|nr:sigma-54 dependent transcriptional regulator [Gemmataceae bacterium]
MTRDILIIDDEEAVCWALERALKHQGHRVRTAASAEQGLALAAKHPPDAVILDVRLPGMDGLSALPKLRELAPDAAVIVVTAFGTLPTAVGAMEGGAFDYLPKPFDLSQALEAVARALDRAPAPAPEPSVPGDDIVGASPAMQAVFKRIALVAPRDASVLITGESGTGKELVARAIHRYSARRDRPFLPVHIAALNPNLVESELFGHAKGAFTGAAQAREGLFALAHGGTVFLDELAEVPLAVQVKLLRALDHNEITPVGATAAQPLDLRILAATNQDLPRRVAEGAFRHDLYFRLNVFEVRLPPLRERPEDIAALAAHFLRRFRPSALPLSPATLAHLQAQPWRGNVRELRNALEHAAIVARDGPLLPAHFPEAAAPAATEPDVPSAVRRWLAERVRGSDPANLHEELLALAEPALLDEVMRRVRGNRVAAAAWLGLNRATVRKKLAHYGLAAVDGEDDEGG